MSLLGNLESVLMALKGDSTPAAAPAAETPHPFADLLNWPEAPAIAQKRRGARYQAEALGGQAVRNLFTTVPAAAASEIAALHPVAQMLGTEQSTVAPAAIEPPTTSTSTNIFPIKPPVIETVPPTAAEAQIINFPALRPDEQSPVVSAIAASNVADQPITDVDTPAWRARQLVQEAFGEIAA